MIKSLALGVVALLVSGSAGAVTFEFLNDQNFKTGYQFEKSEFGGISALAWDQQTPPRLWALSDDRGAKGEPRLYRLKLEVSKGDKPKISVQPDLVLYLKTKEGKSLTQGAIDPESLAFHKDGFLVGSEGDNNLKPRVSPKLLHFNNKGHLLKESSAIPQHYIPEPAGYSKKGIRNNAGFEGLSLSPDQEFLLLGTETTLTQDGPSPSLESGAYTRILKLKSKEGEFIASAEWAYLLEPVKNFGKGSVAYINGITEIMILNAEKALVLERASTVQYTDFKNTVRLYEVLLGEGTDTLKMESLLGKEIKPMTKRLALDLSSMTKSFSEPKSIDNVEAIALGPKLANGTQSLILASDNNFNPTQRTHFIFLVMKP